MRRTARAAVTYGLAPLVCLLLGVSGCTLSHYWRRLRGGIPHQRTTI
jgi:hypothetical protein